jgi:hypothetical protein
MRWTAMAGLMFTLSLLTPVASRASDVTHLDGTALARPVLSLRRAGAR